ncbi:MAG TPA: hypothetical protein VFQ30_06815 [Ktedonobacteraceae bacterium]|nr:hypothetical protein [Ktedonobacteraceae bacterium]
MLFYYLTAGTGWLLIVLLASTILYPFLLRSGALGPVQPFLKRMQFHYWLGYAIIGMIVVHALLSLGQGLAESVNLPGLDLALAALCFALIQFILGLRLRWPKLTRRRIIRRWHFWVMVTIVALLLGHIALDSVTIHALMSKVFVR